MRKSSNYRFFHFQNKKWRWVILAAFILAMLVTGFFSVKNSMNKQQVSAHPAATITIGKKAAGEMQETEFTIPKDSDGIKERAVNDLGTLYKDYHQGDEVIPIANKSNVTSYGSNNSVGVPVLWNVLDIKKTVGGNYIVLFGAVGNGRGGMIKVSVINSAGNIIGEKSIGTLSGYGLRVNTRFYDNIGNKYLIGTMFDTFYTCEIETETSTNATINISKVDSTGQPKPELSIHQTEKMAGEERINGLPLITGPIYPNSLDRSGRIRGRIPIGTIDTHNWESGSMDASAEYQYSLENLAVSEVGLSTGGNESIIGSWSMNDHQSIYGVFRYTNGPEDQFRDTVQIFSQDEVTVNGETLKKREYSYINSTNVRGSIDILEEVSNADYLYFLSREQTETKVIQVDLQTYQQTDIRSFPPDTRMKMMLNSDNSISFYGSTTELTGEFQSVYYSDSLNSPYYYIQGLMSNLTSSDPAKVSSLRALEVDNWINPTHVIALENNEFIIGGTLTDYTKFSDKSLIVRANGTVATGVPSNQGAFLGIITVNDDYAPLISQKNNISVDLSDEQITKPSATNYRGWSTLDRWLITGSKNGLVADVDAVKVYDHFDSNDTDLGATQQLREEWLQKRINRNPKATTDEIEWEKLGFDKNKAGAQLVTYFVTDTQGQSAVTSRWVNKKTSQTIEKEEYLLDAQNFHIPLDGLATAFPDEAAFKRMAKTMAWGKTSHVIDEDGTDASKLSNKVVVNSKQLQALRDATVAKPYPVDVTYKPVSGTELTNRVWVFVTTDNTIPNALTDTPDNGVVFYGNDYSLPFRLRNTHTNNDAVKLADAKVFDYFDSTHEDVDVLPALADATKNPEKIVVDLLPIKSAADPTTVRPSFKYKWEQATDGNHTKDTESTGYVDVELTANVLWHVRQVILDASDEIVVPTESYFDIQNVLTSTGTPDPNYRSNLTGKSGTLTDNPGFTDVVVAVDHLPNVNDLVQLSPIVPEFYQYMGYYYTTDNGTSHATNKTYTGGALQLRKEDLYDVGEYWITMYIKPTTDADSKTKAPQLYSWDYKKNDLGKIKP